MIKESLAQDSFDSSRIGIYCSRAVEKELRDVRLCHLRLGADAEVLYAEGKIWSRSREMRFLQRGTT